MTVQEYSQHVEAFLAELVEEIYHHEAGLKDELEISPIYERYPQLYARGTVEELLSRRQDREARHLAEFAVSGYIENQLRAITEEISNAEARATVEWEGRQLPYRQAPITIANEPDLGRRHDLERRTVLETARLNPQRAARVKRAHELAQELGFADYVTFCDTLGELHLDWLAGQMEQLLARTRPPHVTRITSRLQAAAIPPLEATTADWAFLRRAQEFDGLFPKEELLPALTRTLAGLGIDLAAQENLHVDVEDRPRKSPRAFCAPVRVPQDVWLVIRPHGGHDDYSSILHEAGHAEHFTHTRADLPVAFRHLGDNSVTEAYAFLFGALLRSPAWLRDVMQVAEADEYLALTTFAETYMLRRYAAKLRFELELHRADDLEALSDRYGQFLTEAVQVNVWPQNFLFDLDDGFYVACYLRAWILEVQLRHALIREFGERWFASRDAGAYLRELWGLGQQFSADELAHRLGYEGLEVGPLVEDLVG